MRKRIYVTGSFLLLSGILLTGCGKSAADSLPESEGISVLASEDAAAENVSQSEKEDSSPQTAELTAQFGYDGKSFSLHLYDNDTAAAIAKYVGTSEWNLPIYNYEGFDNCEVMQYYDIPSRYEIPSAAEEITEEKAGAVYYSDPNRIILFYHDAEVPAEYTQVGYFDATDEFIEAVENNPVLEGWGNKIISVRAGE